MATKEVIEELAKDQTIFKRKEYGMWKRLLEICYDKNNSQYFIFGGKGIEVTQLWKERNKSRGYLHFIGDMGFAPSPNHTIARIDSKQDFKPSNCYWKSKGDVAKNTNIIKGPIKIVLKENSIFG